MSGWTTPLALLDEEFIQRADEGVVIPRALRQWRETLHAEHDAWNRVAIDPLYDALMALPDDAELAKREPDDLAGIRALRPAGPRDLHWSPTEEVLSDRLHGAYLGRFSGCALGKPVEGMGMWRDRERGRLIGRERIKRFLQNRQSWPLNDFIPGTIDAGDGMTIGAEPSWRENIAFMEPDDDVHYTLVGLGVMEEYGPEFTWNNVASYWLWHIPVSYICTAEIQAILNYQNRRCSWPNATAATPEFTRRHRNPYREWIGAQIRSDGWAYCAAGKPELAAEFAYRDACWTHTRNGIYGEMLFAAIQSAAFVEPDPAKLVAIGLSEIPADCRLAIAVRALLRWIAETNDWEACMDRIETTYQSMNVVHTINNALICILSLFYGQMHAVRSTTIAVAAGLDTDCNGATVGSIVGAATGSARFDMTLAGRLNDEVRPGMIGFSHTTMTDLARRTAVQWRRVDAWHRSGRTAVAATVPTMAAASAASTTG